MAGCEIKIGYIWTLSIPFQAETPVAPDGATFRADVRANEGAPLLARLTTANGGIVRVSDYEIALIIPASATAAMKPPHVYTDIVRDDMPTAQHEPLDFRLRITVGRTITEPVTT